MAFIDENLVKRASQPSPIITQIDASWQEYVEKVKENIFKLPFSGNYNARITEDYVLIEAYNGRLITNMICAQERTYRLRQPIKCSPFRVFGVYNRAGQFQCFCSEPTIGAHYLNMAADIDLRQMCTGELDYKEPTSFEMLREVCKKVVESRRVIYLESIGSVFLPNDMAELASILRSDSNASTKIKQMLEKKLIKKIL